MNRKKHAGETLIELLLSVLVISLGFSMFAAAVSISAGLQRKNKAALQTYYADRNALHAGERKTEAFLILEEQGIRTNLAAASDHSTGTYPLWLFSGDGSYQEQYRYQRSSPSEAEKETDPVK